LFSLGPLKILTYVVYKI